MPDTAFTLPPSAWNSTTRSSTRSSTSALGSQVRGAGAGHHVDPLRRPLGTRPLRPISRRRPGCAASARARPRACPPGTSSGTRGRASAPGRSGGCSSRQRSCTYAHRAANRQPVGGSTRSGGRPGIAASRVWLGSVDLRDRAQQRLGVRHLHVGEQRGRRRLLDHLARVHHDHLVGAAGDDAEVVGDEHAAP